MRALSALIAALLIFPVDNGKPIIRGTKTSCREFAAWKLRLAKIQRRQLRNFCTQLKLVFMKSMPLTQVTNAFRLRIIVQNLSKDCTKYLAEYKQKLFCRLRCVLVFLALYISHVPSVIFLAIKSSFHYANKWPNFISHHSWCYNGWRCIYNSNKQRNL